MSLFIGQDHDHWDSMFHLNYMELKIGVMYIRLDQYFVVIGIFNYNLSRFPCGMVTPFNAPKICSYFSKKYKRKAADISSWNHTASILILLNKLIEIL